MRISKQVIKILILVILSLFIIQILTFHFFARHQIANRLLSVDLTNKIPYSDSVYVRYNENDRWLNEGTKLDYWAIELNEHKDELKRKLRSGVIIFEDRRSSIQPDDLAAKALLKDRYKFTKKYIAYAKVGSWKRLFNGFECETKEYLFIKDKGKSKRANYNWILFFWLKTFEDLSNYDNVPAANRVDGSASKN